MSATGKRKGFDIYIVGGDHADFPLARRDGAAWADIVGTTSDSFVFDTKQMTVSDRSLWFTDFAEALLRKNKGPLRLVIDEIHLFAPKQGAAGGGIVPNMLHATNNLISLGRSGGIRATMISQRPAKIHNDCLTQAHTLVAMNLIAPHDRNAVKDWIADQADIERGKEIIASLPTLAPGQGWVWAPKQNVLECYRFPKPMTFDSGAAPDDDTAETIALPPVDPEAIKEKLAAVAKETIENNPARLKRTIIELRQQIAAAPAANPDAIKAAEERGFQRAVAEAAANRNKAFISMKQSAEQISVLATRLTDSFDDLSKDVPTPAKTDSLYRRQPIVPLHRNGFDPNAPMFPDSAHLMPRGERACLTAIAQHSDGVTREQLTVLTGYKRSTRDTYVQRLRERGQIDISTNRLIVTAAGTAALGPDYQPLPTGTELQRHVLATLPEGERACLKIAIDAYPDQIERETIDAQTDYKRSTRDTYLQRLSTRELIELTGRGSIRASANLFD